MEFSLNRADGTTEPVQCQLRELIIAGWTGRDEGLVQAHIRELEEMGVTPPARTPMFYRVAASRLSHAPSIDVTGANTSGEVEIVLIRFGGETYVGTGSDHTDRDAEAHGVTLSKQLCDKPLATDLWRYEDVVPHWDDLQLRAWDGDGREAYQDGTAAAMLHPDDLLRQYEAECGALADGSAMFCGTLPVIGGLRPADRFHYELRDPVRGRAIAADYGIRKLPVAEDETD